MNTSNRWLVSIALMAATVMQVLDTTITNVALPHMAGNLGASFDSISWVLTSYLIGTSLVMPLTGYLTDRLGRRRFLVISIAGFVATSALCGAATTLPQIVAFRFLQGMCGAALVPLSQAVMAEVFPQQERGKAMAIWGMGVMVAPIMGPSLGGWLTDALSWRWTFYINLPVGIASLFLVMRYVPDTTAKTRSLDWTAFALLAVSLTALQLVLDRGQQEDWLSSGFIVAAALICAVSFGAFVVRSATNKTNPLFNLAVLRDRNFVVAAAVMAAMGIGLFGGQLLQPQFLENLMGFPVSDAGLYLMPRGLATFAAMILVGRLSSKVSPKLLVGGGLLLSLAGSLLMTRVNAEVTGLWMAMPLALQGFGMGLIFVPMSTLAFSSIAKVYTAEAAGLYSLVRTVGSAVGISLVSTYLARSTQAHWELLRGFASPYRGAATQYLEGLHLLPQTGGGAQILAQTLFSQAQLAAFVDCFWFIAASFLVMAPLLFLMKKGTPTGHVPSHAALAE